MRPESPRRRPESPAGRPELTRRLPELPRVLTAEGAARAGFTAGQVRSQVRRGLWSRLAPGILLTRPELPTRADWLKVGLITGGACAAISGIDAIRLAGVTSGAVELPALVVTRRGRSKQFDGLLVRRTDRPYRSRSTSVLEDPPCACFVELPRGIADAAVWAARDPVRAWVTEAIQRELCTVDDLSGELAAGPRNGSAALRAAIEDVLDGAASIAEARAADFLRRAAVPPFELNVPVVVHGRVIAIVDILFRALRAAIEIDSRKYHDGLRWGTTLDKHNRLTALGLALRHDAPSGLGPGWANAVSGWLRHRASELGVPFRADAQVVPSGPTGPAPLVRG